MSPLAGRWLRFNFVGAIGVAVQMAVLAALKGWFGLDYLAATALAVESAVLHNFIWHQRFTWKERAGGGARDVLLRLVRFHLGNGLVSILGNLALMRLLAGTLRMHYLAAGLIAIAICSLANFLVGERWVFAATSAEACQERRLARPRCSRRPADSIPPYIPDPWPRNPSGRPPCSASEKPAELSA